MIRDTVPGHTVIEDDDHVLLEWEDRDTPLRAIFERGETDALRLLVVETRSRPPEPLDDDSAREVIPRSLLNALVRRGFDIVTEGDVEEAEDEDPDAASDLETRREARAAAPTADDGGTRGEGAN